MNFENFNFSADKITQILPSFFITQIFIRLKGKTDRAILNRVCEETDDKIDVVVVHVVVSVQVAEGEIQRGCEFRQ